MELCRRVKANELVFLMRLERIIQCVSSDAAWMLTCKWNTQEKVMGPLLTQLHDLIGRTNNDTWIPFFLHDGAVTS